MSIVDTKQRNTAVLYGCIATVMALLVFGTATRIVFQVFTGPTIEPIGLGIAVISMIALGLTVVSAGPFREHLSRGFTKAATGLIVCNLGSHLVWLATLTFGGYI